MARYYFEVHINGDIVLDEIGTELPGLSEARDEVAQALVELAKGSLPGTDTREFVVITKLDGEPVLKTRLTYEAVNLDTSKVNLETEGD
jgi:hypothetical protein